MACLRLPAALCLVLAGCAASTEPAPKPTVESAAPTPTASAAVPERRTRTVPFEVKDIADTGGIDLTVDGKTMKLRSGVAVHNSTSGIEIVLMTAETVPDSLVSGVSPSVPRDDQLAKITDAFVRFHIPMPTTIAGSGTDPDDFTFLSGMPLALPISIGVKLPKPTPFSAFDVFSMGHREVRVRALWSEHRIAISLDAKGKAGVNQNHPVIAKGAIRAKTWSPGQSALQVRHVKRRVPAEPAGLTGGGRHVFLSHASVEVDDRHSDIYLSDAPLPCPVTRNWDELGGKAPVVVRLTGPGADVFSADALRDVLSTPQPVQAWFESTSAWKSIDSKTDGPMRGYIAIDQLELKDNAPFSAAVSLASPVPWFASDGEKPMLSLAGELDGKVCLTPLFHAVDASSKGR